MKKYFDYIRSVLITGLFILVLSTPAISQAKSEENHADHEDMAMSMIMERRRKRC